VRHESAVRTEQLERATKPLVGISQRWLTPPQFRGATVEFLNHTRSRTRIDGHGTQVEQGAIPFFARAQFRAERFHRLAGLNRIFHYVEGDAAGSPNLDADS
jgi:hypothetical protein